MVEVLAEIEEIQAIFIRHIFRAKVSISLSRPVYLKLQEPLIYSDRSPVNIIFQYFFIYQAGETYDIKKGTYSVWAQLYLRLL